MYVCIARIEAVCIHGDRFVGRTGQPAIRFHVLWSRAHDHHHEFQHDRIIPGHCHSLLAGVIDD